MHNDPLPKDVVYQHARMVYLAIRDGNLEQAHNAVDRAFQVAHELRARVTLDSPTAALFGLRLCNLLESHGVHTVRDLVAI